MWWAYMIRGVLAGILGLCALFWPSATVGLLVTLVGKRIDHLGDVFRLKLVEKL